MSAHVPMRFEYGGAEATLSWFAALDEDLGPEYLMWTIERVAKGPADLDRQVAAWQAGDLGVAEVEDAAMKLAHPRLYERMVVDRNRDWVPRILPCSKRAVGRSCSSAAVTWSAPTAFSRCFGALAWSRTG